MSARHHALQGSRWAAVRRAVFDRDGYRCRKCGKAGRLECDHIVPLAAAPDQDPFDPTGCQALCRGCHIDKSRAERRPAAPPPGRAAWRALVAEMLTPNDVRLS